MRNRRLPAIRVGDVVTVAEGDYHAGIGRLTLSVVEVGARERHTDGVWLHLRGVQLRQPDLRVRLRQRRVLVRLDAVRVLPSPRSSFRWLPLHRPGRPDGSPDRPNEPSAAYLGGSAGPHIAARPSWRCLNCRREWPCPDRRANLLARYRNDRFALLLYLGLCLTEASFDLQDLPPEQAYHRFIGWARQHPPPTGI
nr:hypothetical protein [Micromonospora sp. DSM 115978]